MSCMMDVLKMGGSCGLVEKLWAQVILTAGRVNVEVALTRNEVALSSVILPESASVYPDLRCCFASSQSS